MTQDYVRTTRPPRKRKPAGRSAAGRRSAPPAFPMVRVVLAVALVIGFGIFLYVLKGSAGTPKETTKAAPVVKPIPIEDQRPAKEKFDYMTLLENKEVNVDLPSGATPTDLSIDPEQRKRLLAQQELLEQQRLKAQQQSGALTPTQGGGQSSVTTGSTPKLSEPERAAALLAGQIVPFASTESKSATPAAPATPAAVSNRVMMQCGAFRSADQAASMKLRLSQQGQYAQVQQAQTASGSWYKVVLGPFTSRTDAEHKKAELQARHLVDNCTLWN
jgi:cell division protein FtsN